MDQNEEYHDPDYPGAAREAHQGARIDVEEEKIEKIRKIVRREFSQELEAREADILLLDQRSLLARRMLHRVRYALVNNYYNEERLKLTSLQIQDEISAQTERPAQAQVSNVLREMQRRLHPSVRKLLGKQSSNVELHDILFRRRAPRNKSRKDYSAMLQVRKSTSDPTQIGITTNASCSSLPDITSSQSGSVGSEVGRSVGSLVGPRKPRSLQPEVKNVLTVDDPARNQSKHRYRIIIVGRSVGSLVGPRKPRSLQPEVRNVLTVDDPARNQSKHRYRIIIGNTSKYAPPASSADKSTHKWLLYVRGPPSCPLLGFLKGVTVRLHHSYAPHHTLHIDKPPFHISRRGWGEFPAKIELHFAMPERNRPVTVEHTIKLDRHYTGFQTLGAETIVDVWLYSNEEMLQYEFKEDDDVVKPDSQTQMNKVETPIVQPKQEIVETQEENNVFENTENHTDNWLDFFTNTTELDVDEMIIKPVKKIEDRPDLENMIETSVIQKENTQNHLIDHTETKIKQEIVETDVNIKIEPQDEDPLENSFVNNKTIDYACKKEIEDIPNELLSTTSPKKRIMKYMDPTTGKIYYLEMDRKLDLSKVQEIVINSKGNIKTAKISPIKPNGLKHVRKNTKKGVSLLKPEVKSLLKTDNTKVQNVPRVPKHIYSHIENDHCYLGPTTFKEPGSCNNLTENFEEPVSVKKEKSVYETVLNGVKRLNGVKVAVDLCLRNVPLISAEVGDPDFVKHFPFIVESEEKYWKLDFAKRRNLEWSRAKFINKLLTEHLNTTENIWRTKQILIYSRMHGYYPVRPDVQRSTINEPDWSSWIDLENRKSDTNIRELYPNASDISTLTIFDENKFSQNLSDSIDLVESDEEIEIVKCDEEVKVKKEMLPDTSKDLPVLPVLDSEERLRYLFLEKKCADIGIELRNEDVGNGYSYSCVHAVLLSAMKSFASELVRASLAAKQSSDTDSNSVWQGSTSRRTTLNLVDVWRGANSSPRLHALTQRGLGTHTHKPEGL